MFIGSSIITPLRQGPPSNELCHRAFRFNQAFLVLQYMMLLLAVGLFATALFTLVYSPRDYLDVRLEVRCVCL